MQKIITPYSNQAISESTEARNENGYYWGLNLKSGRKFELSAYADLFRFPWLKYRVDAPSSGYELLAQLSFNFTNEFKLVARVKRQQKEENSQETFAVEPVVRSGYRAELVYSPGRAFTLRNRVEVASYKKGIGPHEFGFLAYQDIIYSPLNARFSGNFRFALFDTQGFNSRIYSYENDVLYAYSVPAYQGSGLRYYLNIRHRLGRKIDVWLRYALLSQADSDQIGSGFNKIDGANRSDIKLQFRLQF